MHQDVAHKDRYVRSMEDNHEGEGDQDCLETLHNLNEDKDRYHKECQDNHRDRLDNEYHAHNNYNDYHDAGYLL